VCAVPKKDRKPTILNNTFNTLASPFVLIAIGVHITVYMEKNGYGK
jgi:hypothetical protein